MGKAQGHVELRVWVGRSGTRVLRGLLVDGGKETLLFASPEYETIPQSVLRFYRNAAKKHAKALDVPLANESEEGPGSLRVPK